MGDADFMRLFIGSQAAVGGEEGRAIRCADGAEWIRYIHSHLHGNASYGVYPMTHNEGGWFVHWGCVDFDIKSERHKSFDYETEGEADVAARNLQAVLAAFGVTAWIERTRSHGRHVWVFARQWVPAPVMRRALLVACEIADVPSREVNPKQESLAPDQLGNYVRLPFGNGPNEQVILDHKLDEFVMLALEARTETEVLHRISGLYREPPPPPKIVGSFDYDGLPPTLNAAGRSVIANGPQDGDRSRGMVYVAAQCRESGLTPQQAYDVLLVTDDAWGKYVGRRDREQRLQEIVERGYRH